MKILNFTPHSFLDVHSVPEAIVLNALKKNGTEIIQIHCNGVMGKHCLCMAHVEYNDWKQKKKICNTCKSNRDTIINKFNFKSLHVDDFIDEMVFSEIEKIKLKIDQINFKEFVIDGHPIGLFSIYEFYLNHKLSTPIIPKSKWPEFLSIFENSIKIYYAVKKIFEQEKPTHFMVYNSWYSINRIACSIADEYNIPHYFLHAGSNLEDRLQQIMIFKGIKTPLLINKHPFVDVYRNNSIPTQNFDKIKKHVWGYLHAKSPWVYSIASKKLNSYELRKKLNIDPGMKVLLAVMRSNDERSAATFAGLDVFKSRPMFKSQLDWLNWLNKFAERHPEYKIIFRVHPREYPNKRESVLSESAKKMEEYLSNKKLSKNFYLNTPLDPLSLHDLFKITDLVLNNSSTAGLEASLFGIPVLGIGDDLYSFDPAIQIEAKNVHEYEEKIHDLSNKNWNFDNVKKAYRWLNYLNHEAAIDIGDVYFSSNSFLIKALRLISTNLNGIKKGFALGLGIKPLIYFATRPAKNQKKLIFAISNKQDSHIGFFPPFFGCEKVEYNFISHDLVERAKFIASYDDKEFFLRIESIFFKKVIEK